MNDPRLSLQLYSLRRETASDPESVLRTVPVLGFDGIELAGDYGWSAEKWQELLSETALRVAGAHVGLEFLEQNFAAQAAFAKAVGNRRLIVPAAPDSLRNAKGYAEAARRLNALGKRCVEEGLSLYYHNHAFEFSDLGGTHGMEILMGETDPGLVGFEVDTYWVERGGRDSLEYIRKHTARIGLIHAKELRKSTGEDVAVGDGDVPFREIIPHARQHNWPIVVEYEGEGAPDVVKRSAAYLSQLLSASAGGSRP